MSSFGLIIDGYIMAAIVYSCQNWLLRFTLRRHTRIPWWGVAVLTLLQTVAVYQSLHLFWMGGIFVLFIFFVIFRRATDVEPYKLMYLVMVVVAYTTAVSLVFFMAWGCAYTWRWPEVFWMIAVFSLTSPFVAYGMDRVLWPRLSALELPHPRWLWIVPALIITIVMIIGSAHIQHLLAGYEIVYGLTSILLVFFSSGVGLMILVIMGKMQAAVNYENDLRIMDLQISSQSRRYAEVLQYMDEIRVMRHDMRHYTRAALMLLKEGKLDELRTFLDSFEQDNRLYDNIIYSKNYISDLVAHHVHNVARSANIHVSIHCGLPESFWVCDTDLCVLLGNLMENALNACRLQVEGPREITATMAVRDGEAFIRVENTCADKALDTPARRKEAGLLQSNGCGISSVRAVVAKYNGFAAFEPQDGRFYASVLLYRPDASGVIKPEKQAKAARSKKEMLNAM